jgi:hypothetical protein
VGTRVSSKCTGALFSSSLLSASVLGAVILGAVVMWGLPWPWVREHEAAGPLMAHLRASLASSFGVDLERAGTARLSTSMVHRSVGRDGPRTPEQDSRAGAVIEPRESARQ